MLKPINNKIIPEVVPPEQKLKNVAEMYEKHFLREMMRSMRSTVHEGGFVKTNTGEKIFREQLDQEYVEKWGDRGGIGLADMIYDQLIEKFGVQMGIKQAPNKPVGPVLLNEKSQYSIQRQKSMNQPDRTLSYQIEKNPKNFDKTMISSPWSGTLLNQMDLSVDEKLIEIAHDNGLKSQIIFRGLASPLSSGQKLESGETVGLLSPEAKTFFWNIQNNLNSVSE